VDVPTGDYPALHRDPGWPLGGSGDRGPLGWSPLFWGSCDEVPERSNGAVSKCAIGRAEPSYAVPEREVLCGSSAAEARCDPIASWFVLSRPVPIWVPMLWSA